MVAIGSPAGLNGTVTSGIISALDRDVTVSRDESRGGSGQGGGREWPFEYGGEQFNGETGERPRPTRRSRPTPRSTRATPAAP
ncbi:hypothetical protein ACW23B_13735 [Streptomyces albidoflavus]